MTITVNTESSEGFRHSIQVDDHQLFTDLPSTPVAKAPPPSPMTTSMPPWGPARP